MHLTNSSSKNQNMMMDKPENDNLLEIDDL